MRISQIYSHIYAEEFLLVHHKEDFKNLLHLIEDIKVVPPSSKSISRSKLKDEFRVKLNAAGWLPERKHFHVSTDPKVVVALESKDFTEQKELIRLQGQPSYRSCSHLGFLKNRIGVEVQLGKYFAVTYDLFVKHLSFYTGEIIDVGIEIVPMKSMQQRMSSGPPWFEKEVHNVLRHGRTNPPVPLLIIGIEP